jgi:hypothetical protein
MDCMPLKQLMKYLVNHYVPPDMRHDIPGRMRLQASPLLQAAAFSPVGLKSGRHPLFVSRSLAANCRVSLLTMP